MKGKSCGISPRRCERRSLISEFGGNTRSQGRSAYCKPRAVISKSHKISWLPHFDERESSFSRTKRTGSANEKPDPVNEKPGSRNEKPGLGNEKPGPGNEKLGSGERETWSAERETWFRER